MKHLILFLLSAGLCTFSAAAQQTPKHPELVRIVDSLYNEDQNCQYIKPVDSAVAAYQRAIHARFPEMKRIVDTYGFPGYDMLGKEGAGHFFVLVQHSDFDVAFQKKALELMKPQVKKGNASGQSYAYLTDRVEINEGRLQIYGTQVNMSANTQPKPCIDPKNLDKRRKSVGLSPIKDYLEQCNEAYFQLNPQEKKN